MEHIERLDALISSLCSLLYVGSLDYQGIVKEFIEIATRHSMDVYRYNISNGTWKSGKEAPTKQRLDPIEALDHILSLNQQGWGSRRKLFLLEHFDLLLENRDPLMLTKLRLITDQTTHQCTTIMIGRPFFPLPAILSDVARIDVPILGDSRIREILKACEGALSPEELDEMTGLLRNLTALECENLLSLSLVCKKGLDSAFVGQEKVNMIHRRANGLIQLCQPEGDLSQVGGLDALKEWFGNRASFFRDQSSREQRRIPCPKGVLLTGPPGCGKSFIVAALAGSWGVTLVRLDPSRLFSIFVGETEQKLFLALKKSQRHLQH